MTAVTTDAEPVREPVKDGDTKLGYCQVKARGCQSGNRLMTWFKGRWWCARCYRRRESIR